ncbi:MAG: isopenicillin N synthase family oxygenase [Acidimicrobiia bacterium]|nr:isopenicillin N synthase family oxygenase [Acidimicrobiia bacterium]
MIGSGLPLVDLEPVLAEPDDGTARSIVTERLDAACRRTGFFVVTGHGLDHLLAAAFEQARAFFALDQETKELVPRANRFGFVPQRDLALDRTRLSGATEYLDVGLGDDLGLGSVDGERCWPPLPGFRAAIQDYQREAMEVAAVLLGSLATALDLEPDFFATRMRHPPCKLRLLHYLPTPLEPGRVRPITNAAHTDYGAITLLATGGAPGLELRPRGGDWTPVEAPAGALIVNLGDLLAVWTNLRYTSTPHRVVSSPDSDRFSIPFFVNPDDETLVECLPTCVSDDNPCRQRSLTAGDYLAGRIDGTIPEPYIDAR